jgi:hypothetical protein
MAGNCGKDLWQQCSIIYNEQLMYANGWLDVDLFGFIVENSALMGL